MMTSLGVPFCTQRPCQNEMYMPGVPISSVVGTSGKAGQRFSTMMGWPSDIRMPSLKTRPSVSVGPPAGNGTIIVMGCVGYSCARAPIPQAKLAHPSAAATATARDIVFMGSLLVFCGDDDTRADNAKVRSAVVLPT